MICGHCNERHDVLFDCTTIQSLKKKMDEALSAIQADYKKQIEDCRGEIRWLIDLVDIIGKKVGVTSERIKEVKNSSVDYTSPHYHMGDALNLSLKPYQKVIFERMQKVHSQKHLEKCLRERNEKIKELEDKIEHREAVIKNRDEMIERRNKKIADLEDHLGKRNGECQNALNKANMQEQIAKQWQLEYNATAERREKLKVEIEAMKVVQKSNREEYDSLSKAYDNLQRAFYSHRN